MLRRRMRHFMAIMVTGLILAWSGVAQAAPPAKYAMASATTLASSGRSTWNTNMAIDAALPAPHHPVRIIVIDPGHGGENEGAIGVAGIHEKHLTLSLGLRLAEVLRERHPDVHIVLTREDDQFVSLADRIAIANHLEADLFLSLHFNSSTNPEAIGFESFWAGEYAEQESAKLGDDEDIRIRKQQVAPLAEHIANCFNWAMSERFDVLDRGVKEGDYTVLTRAEVPAVVLEFAFLSHAVEGLAATMPDQHDLMIEAVIEAIERFQYNPLP